MHFALKCISFCPSKKQASQLILSPGSAECGSLSGGRSGSRRSREERPSIRFVPHITAPRYGTRALYSTMARHHQTRAWHSASGSSCSLAPAQSTELPGCWNSKTLRIALVSTSLQSETSDVRCPLEQDGSIWLPPLIYPSFILALHITRSTEMNIAPDVNNNLRSIDLFRSMII